MSGYRHMIKSGMLYLTFQQRMHRISEEPAQTAPIVIGKSGGWMKLPGVRDAFGAGPLAPSPSGRGDRSAPAEGSRTQLPGKPRRNPDIGAQIRYA
jgi:hypothetical protein